MGEDKPDKNLSFWQFGDKHEEVETSQLPYDRLVSSKEMQYMNDRLYARMSKYKDSSCYIFLEEYYDIYLSVQKVKKHKEIENNMKTGLKWLKLFTYCYEMENKMKKQNNNMYI